MALWGFRSTPSAPHPCQKQAPGALAWLEYQTHRSQKPLLFYTAAIIKAICLHYSSQFFEST